MRNQMFRGLNGYVLSPFGDDDAQPTAQASSAFPWGTLIGSIATLGATIVGGVVTSNSYAANAQVGVANANATGLASQASTTYALTSDADARRNQTILLVGGLGVAALFLIVMATKR